MIPFVHEVGATIACEYFNEFNYRNKKKYRAFVLVTAGPGITNAMTGVAGSYLESRELLIIGGQVKKADLKSQKQRQNGIQEIDGASICSPITKISLRIDKPVVGLSLDKLINESSYGRKGPVFIEMHLDVQAKKIKINPSTVNLPNFSQKLIPNFDKHKKIVKSQIKKSKRPIILLGSGVNTKEILRYKSLSKKLNIPIQTTWNGITNISSENRLYFGRPNTWGQRYANIIIQQADLIIAIGTGLGLQQTGFNWKSFGKSAKIIHVNIDKNELNKPHPDKYLKIHSDGNNFMHYLLNEIDPAEVND